MVDHGKVFCQLEKGAARAKGAWIVRDDGDAFRTEPIDDIQSNVAQVIDCVDLTVVLIGYQDLATVRPEC